MVLITKLLPVVDSIATGALARRTRQTLDLSLREVARRMGVSAPFVSDLERGRRNWTLSLVTRYKNALCGITAADPRNRLSS